MRFIADLHTHSKYARACSPALTLENIDAWCRVKGVDIVSTGDFTHPRWFEELRAKLQPSGREGLYALREGLAPTSAPPIAVPKKPTLFMAGTEIACIYSQGAKKMRRVHHCVYAPSIEVAAKVNAALAARGCKLASDGRPIIGMSSKELLKLLLAVDPRCVLIPAHAWTPWFAIFGSNSGFDSIEECFEELTPHIFAIETGLSSDPPMNWRLSELDNVALVSHSDAHSLPNLGREADVFEGEKDALSYDTIMEAIRNAAPATLSVIASPDASVGAKQSQEPVIPDRDRGSRLISNLDSRRSLPSSGIGGGNDNMEGKIAASPSAPRNDKGGNLKMLGTIEFIPDEGRYHYDGHRACKVYLHPKETKKLGGVCPKCKKPVTVGVLSRVEELANETEGRVPEKRPEFWSLVELDKIIAEAEGVKGRAAKSVDKHYWDLVAKAGTEMNVLLNMPLDALLNIAPPRLVEAIKRVREGKVKIDPPGYDGKYGVVNIFTEHEKNKQQKQTLF